MKILFTCDPGLEDITAKEVVDRLSAFSVIEKFKGFQGRVLAEIPDKFQNKIFSLHSIHHAIIFLSEFSISSLDSNGLKEISEEIQSLNLDNYFSNVHSFRVTTQRIGNHSFTSIDVQKAVGAAIVEKYNKKVDLKNYDLNLRVDVYGHYVFVGIQLTKESLYKRFKRVFNHPAGIKTTLAYGLLQLADINEGQILLDPMCGGGTILMEAASIWRNKIKIIGGDVNEKYLEGAQKNAEANGFDNIKFVKLDARKLDEYFEKSSIDRIVTNPPYGIRMRIKELKNLYKDFIESAYYVLKPDGKIVVLTVRAESFRIIVFRSKKYKIVEERVVESGGLYPHVFVLEKL